MYESAFFPKRQPAIHDNNINYYNNNITNYIVVTNSKKKSYILKVCI